ncbi:MAG: NADPH:quinone oxidoreductase family protein [Pseudomonadota bacterium]
MKALLSENVGGPETLVIKEVDVPEPANDEVRIRVRACGVNYPDSLIIEDKYQFKPPRPFSPGGEVSGEVDAVGSDVNHLKPGDKIIGLVGWGGMSEYVVTKAFKCAPMPESMPYSEAAAFIFTYGTSYHALKQRANMQNGETLLVLGAAGGVGLAAVELGKAMGARVLAAVSSQEKLDVAIKHGADDGFVYPTGNFNDRAEQKALAAQFKELCGKSGADVIYDAVGGAYAEASLRAIAWNGRFLVVGFPAGIPTIPLNLPLLKGCQIVGVFWGAFTERETAENTVNNQELIQFYVDKKITPFVSREFSLEQAGQAISALANRQAVGKLVVTMN